jgi:hypothetical protein
MNLDAPDLHRVQRFLASVRGGAGHPDDSRQRGKGGFFPGLTARPWHLAEDWDVTRAVTAVLEGRAADILAEHVRASAASTFLSRHPASELHPTLTGKAWGIHEVWRGGRFQPGARRSLPVLCAALDELTPWLAPTGQVAFHGMEPGARLRPHADGPNTTLTCHLGVDVPDGCWLRVGGETRTWTNGRCLWFDHSFEHDAANESALPRTILLLDIVHPDITPAELAFWSQRWAQHAGR